MLAGGQSVSPAVFLRPINMNLLSKNQIVLCVIVHWGDVVALRRNLVVAGTIFCIFHTVCCESILIDQRRRPRLPLLPPGKWSPWGAFLFAPILNENIV